MIDNALGYNQDNDLLLLNNDKEIKAFLKDEVIIFSDIINKINKYNMSQERIIVITNKAVYNLKKKELKRRIEYNIIKGITTLADSEKIIIHCEDFEHDYFYESTRIRKVVQMLCFGYKDYMKKELRIYIVDDKDLGNYVTLKNEKKKNVQFSRMPESIKPITFNDYITGNYINEGDFNCVDEERKDLGQVETIETCSLNSIELLKVIGRGLYSKVFLVRIRSSAELYVMKVYKKNVLIQNNILPYVTNEKNILSSIKSPFVINSLRIMQNEGRLFFFLPYFPNGDLYSVMKKELQLDEPK